MSKLLTDGGTRTTFSAPEARSEDKSLGSFDAPGFYRDGVPPQYRCGQRSFEEFVVGITEPFALVIVSSLSFRGFLKSALQCWTVQDVYGYEE